MKRIVVLLTVVALMVVMVAVSASPAFARTTFGPPNDPRDPALCVHGVAQTFGSDPGHNAADALGAFCYLPINKEIGKGR
jgi:hypothetical protein